MSVICINGAPGAGKDLFVYYCTCSEKGTPIRVVNISTVDFVKYIAKECGWDETKTPKNRKFLCDLKNLLTEWGDVPYQKVKEEILKETKRHGEGCVIFVHVREPEEIQRFVNELGAKTLVVRRETAEKKLASNDADKNVLQYDYDYTVENNGTVEELKQQAELFMSLLEEHKTLSFF